MSTLVVRLLGPSEIERDGVVVAPPRGHKAWAVLAYVVLAERPVARTRLAGLAFGDAGDPRGALRWTLAQLRRALGVAGALRGDPLELALPAGAAVDVLALASGDPDPGDRERAAVLGVRGKALSDRAHYGAAIGLLGESVATARQCGDVRQTAWSLALLGRALLLRYQLPEAVEVLDESLALVAEEAWVAVLPFPEAMRAEVALGAGDPDHAIALLDHAFALGCRLGDPCWEAMAARARGRVHEAAGERASALAWLRDAAVRAVRVADPYVWMHAYCLEALARVAIADAAPDARECVAQLERLAARGDMRELVVRAAMHRARLGDPSGVESARLLGESIDNAALHAELAAAV